MSPVESLKRAYSHVRYWMYRRSLGSPIPLVMSLREAVRRYQFERINAQQGKGE